MGKAGAAQLCIRGDADSPLFSRKAMAQEGHVAQADVAILLELFEDAKTFGSLIWSGLLRCASRRSSRSGLAP